MGEVQTIIRKKLHLTRDQNLFLLADGKHLLKQDARLTQVYDKFKNEDQFLYLQFAQEKTYG